MTHVIASKSGGDIRTWRVVDNTLVDPKTYPAATSDNRHLELTRDGLWLFSGWASGTTNDDQVFRRANDGGTLGDEEQISGTPDASINDLRLSPDGNWLAVCHSDNGSGDYSGNSLSIFAIDGGDLTLVTSISLPSAARNTWWNDRSDRLVVTRNNSGSASLYAWNSVALSLLDTLAVSDDADPLWNVQWMQGSLVAVERLSLTTALLSAANDELSGLATVTGHQGGKMARYQHLLADAGSSGDVYIWDTSAGSFVEVDSLEDQAEHVAMHESGELLVGDDVDEINLIAFDGESMSLVDTAAWESTIRQILIYPYWAPEVPEPLTPEEEFNATYADASGRDPLPTMLVDGPSCQRAINTYTRFWAGVGEPLVVPVYVPLGELSLIEHGQVVVVKSQRHAIGLETGRAAIVMRDRIDPRSGTCELTVMPSKQDIEE